MQNGDVIHEEMKACLDPTSPAFVPIQRAFPDEKTSPPPPYNEENSYSEAVQYPPPEFYYNARDGRVYPYSSTPQLVAFQPNFGISYAIPSQSHPSYQLQPLTNYYPSAPFQDAQNLYCMPNCNQQPELQYCYFNQFYQRYPNNRGRRNFRRNNYRRLFNNNNIQH